MINAVIIDDEPYAADVLQQLCERSGRVRIAGRALDGASGMQMLVAMRPELVFLDIGMPGMSGLDVAARLQTLPEAPRIVFVTAYDHFATEAFDLSVADYLLKPVDPERLARAIERAAAHGREPADLWVPHAGSIVRLPIAQLTRVEAERDYVRLQTAERSYLLREPMAVLEARLDPAQFLRVHRSTLVRADCIRALRHVGAGAWEVVDEAGRGTRVGRSYLPRVRATLGIEA